MVLKGSVENIIFVNEENGYTIFDLVSENELVTVTGAFPNLCEGEELILTGEYTINPKYGRQFNAVSADRRVPTDEYALSRYLGSGLIKGVGPVTAAAIVQKFGKKTVQVIENSPHFLSEIKGITKAKAQEIGRAFSEIKRMQAAMLFLQKYDLSLNLSLKIFQEYGDDTEKLLSENPYRLVEEIEGVGFLSADRIAQKMGVEPESQYRLRAGISYCLENAAQTSGNTYLPEPLLIDGLKSLLRCEIDEDTYISAKKDLIINGRIKAVADEEQGFCRVALCRYYAAEKSIAARLIKIISGVSALSADPDGEIADYERLHDIEFAGKQREAVRAAVNGAVTVITGGPGTGKTTIVKGIIYVLKKRGIKTVLCAPTGRAAKRLSQSTGEDAKTIHRTLEADFSRGGGSYFTYNERNPLDAGCVIVDEVSMVDAQLMAALLKAVRSGSRLILVGDKDQLPSVGAGNVLADILHSGKVPAVYLDTIFRQAESSQIIVNAHSINKGIMPDLNKKDSDFFFSPKESGGDINSTVLEMCTRRIPEFLNIEPLSIQVLAPMKNGLCGIDNINAGLQNLLNPPSPLKREIKLENIIFRTGDKVMQTQNNYNIEWRRAGAGFSGGGTGVFNGDIGIISEVTEDNELLVMFEDDKAVKYARNEIGQLTLAYAITIHKSQGCEFDVVIIPVISGSYMILTRNLLYTSVTRAKKMCVLVGSRENIGRMVRNNYTAERYTMLCSLLETEWDKHIDI